MSDLDDETDTSCGEEQIVSDWEVQKEWLESILSKYHNGRAVSHVDVICDLPNDAKSK